MQFYPESHFLARTPFLVLLDELGISRDLGPSSLWWGTFIFSLAWGFSLTGSAEVDRTDENRPLDTCLSENHDNLSLYVAFIQCMIKIK